MDFSKSREVTEHPGVYGGAFKVLQWGDIGTSQKFCRSLREPGDFGYHMTEFDIFVL